MPCKKPLQHQAQHERPCTGEGVLIERQGEFDASAEHERTGSWHASSYWTQRKALDPVHLARRLRVGLARIQPEQPTQTDRALFTIELRERQVIESERTDESPC